MRHQHRVVVDQSGGLGGDLLCPAFGAGGECKRRLFGDKPDFSGLGGAAGGGDGAVGQADERRHIGLRADHGDGAFEDGSPGVGKGDYFCRITAQPGKQMGGAAQEFGGAGTIVAAEFGKGRLEVLVISFARLSHNPPRIIATA